MSKNIQKSLAIVLMALVCGASFAAMTSPTKSGMPTKPASIHQQVHQ